MIAPVKPCAQICLRVAKVGGRKPYLLKTKVIPPGADFALQAWNIDGRDHSQLAALFGLGCDRTSIMPAMNSLPDKIYRAAQVREIDRIAIERCEIPGFTLMSRAGQRALTALRERWPRSRRLLVLCGAGNNAGDGYVVARLAAASGFHVVTVALVDPAQLGGDAELAYSMYVQGGGRLTAWDPLLLKACDVVVDAILGTGLSRELTGEPCDVVTKLNSADRPVLAIDIPTGLHADSGQAMGAAVRADLTVSFVGLKLGLFTGDGPEYAGEVRFDGLGIPPEAYEGLPHAGNRISRQLVREVLPRRPRTSHKGKNGHVLVVGGGEGMPGAIRLAAEAALHAGAGLVTVATLAKHVPIVVAQRPEIMATAADDVNALESLLEAADVVAIGPGLGQGKWAKSLLRLAMQSDKPLVVDADALNLIAARPAKRENWILTPHPGEAARLLSDNDGHAKPAAIQADRVAALSQLIDKYSGVVVLKGAGTIVARRGELPWFCDKGNPGMAAAGMGDVLTGVIAGIAAQCGDLFAAARAGVWVHGSAGNAAALGGERGIIASDLFGHIVTYVNPD